MNKKPPRSTHQRDQKRCEVEAACHRLRKTQDVHGYEPAKSDEEQIHRMRAGINQPVDFLGTVVERMYLLFRPVVTTSLGFAIRSLIEAYGAIASIKYGIWAVTMNIANASLGAHLELENWMLIFSHLGMAIEACLYTAYLSYGRLSAFIAAISLFVNDFVDYTYGVFPWLTKTLLLHLHSIQMFTVCLSGLSLLLTGILIQRRQHLQKQRTGLLSQSPS